MVICICPQQQPVTSCKPTVLSGGGVAPPVSCPTSNLSFGHLVNTHGEELASEHKLPLGLGLCWSGFSRETDQCKWL